MLANPWAVWLLMVLPVLGTFAVWARYRRRQALLRMGSISALLALTAPLRGRRLLRNTCLVLGLFLLVAGIAGPQWGRDWNQAATAGRDLVVVLDLSRSMLAEQPSRQERAQRALRDLCDTIQQRGGHRLALVVFAGRARVVCPLTHDYDHFRFILARQDADNLSPELRPGAGGPASGTRIGAALRLAVRTHEERFAGAQDILLISDGDDPAGDEEWAEGAAAAHQQGIPIHTVGVGDPETDHSIPTDDGVLKHQDTVIKTRLDEKPLQEIARRSRGTYIPARTQGLPLGKLFREVIASHGTRDVDERLLPSYLQHYPWCFGPALGLLLLGLSIGEGPLLRKRSARGELGALVPRSRPRSTALRAAWLVPLALLLVSAAPLPVVLELIRQGNAAFAEEQFAKALQLYEQAEERTTDPGLVAFNKAAALYRLKRFREAELHYRRSVENATGPRRTRGLYDLGNCLLRLAEDRDLPTLEQAMRCYEQCLRQPDLGDALRTDVEHNLELTRLLWSKAREATSKNEPKQDPQASTQTQKAANDPGNAQQGETPGQTGQPSEKGKPGLDKQLGKEQQPVETQDPAAGRGKLQTLPDKDQLTPLAPEDTAAHLERVAERILRERREYRRLAPGVPRNVKDW